MDWQVMLKLFFIIFLPVANPEIPLHIGKIALYDNTSPTSEIFSPEVSVKIECYVLFESSVFTIKEL